MKLPKRKPGRDLTQIALAVLKVVLELIKALRDLYDHQREGGNCCPP